MHPKTQTITGGLLISPLQLREYYAHIVNDMTHSRHEIEKTTAKLILELPHLNEKVGLEDEHKEEVEKKALLLILHLKNHKTRRKLKFTSKTPPEIKNFLKVMLS